jgi:outer membrane lipoprotein SlyB
MNARFAVPALATLSLAACATGPYYSDRADPYYETRYVERHEYRDERVACERCGTVDRIERLGGSRTTGAGAVTGAIVGGAIGNQVGSGDGRRAATVAGAVLGGVAGNRIERNARDDRYEIFVTLDDGRRVVVDQDELHGIHEGARVFVSNGRARLL